MANLILDCIPHLQCIMVQKASSASGGPGSLPLEMCLFPAHGRMNQGLRFNKVGVSELGPRVECSPSRGVGWQGFSPKSMKQRRSEIVTGKTPTRLPSI